jgi:type IV secretory pathway VirB9-like protein
LKQYYKSGFALICAATIGLGHGAGAQSSNADPLVTELEEILTKSTQDAGGTATGETPRPPLPTKTGTDTSDKASQSLKGAAEILQLVAPTTEQKPQTKPETVVVKQALPAPIPHVSSIAEGQAQIVRGAASVLALRKGFVSPGAGLRLEVVFGHSYPVLVCKVGLTCLIELEDGEEMLDAPLLSDPVRWEVAVRIRDEPIHKTYMALKPRMDAGEATIALFTNRRTYYIVLVPDLVAHTPILAFSYPASDLAKVEQVIAARKSDKAKAVAATKAKKARSVARAKAARQSRVAKSGVKTTTGSVPADELNFNYRMTGNASFKPVRVFTDGKRTYVELPSSYRGEVPVLIAGGSNSNSTVNIAVKKGGRQLIADKMLTSFTLLAGNKKIRVKKGL